LYSCVIGDKISTDTAVIMHHAVRLQSELRVNLYFLPTL